MIKSIIVAIEVIKSVVKRIETSVTVKKSVVKRIEIYARKESHVYLAS